MSKSNRSGFFNPERANLACDRMRKDVKKAEKYANEHPAQSVLVLGGLLLAAFYDPKPVILALCALTLAYIGITYSKSPTVSERAVDLVRGLR